MNPTIAVRVDDDTTILFETADQDTVVAASRGTTAAVGETLQTMLGRVRPVLDVIASELRSIPQRPDRYAVELGVSLTTEAGLVIAKTAADAHFTFTLEWRPQRSSENPDAGE